MVRDTSLCGLGQTRAQPRAHDAAALPPRVRGPHPGQALPRRRVRGPRALALRELLPAAHEHPALPAALQGGPARGRVPVGDPRQPAARLHRARLPAPLRRPLPARRRRRGRQHARRAPPHRRLGPPRRDRFEAMVERVARAQAASPRASEVAVVGAGPTGLTCAYYLALLGHDVTVYESRRRGRRHAALRAARVPPAEGGPRDGRSSSSSAWACASCSTRRSATTSTLNDLAHAVRRGLPRRSAPGRRPGSTCPGTELTGVLPALPFLEGVARERAAPRRPEGGGDRRRQRRHRLGAHAPAGWAPT